MTSITVEKFKHEELVNVLTHLPGVFIGITFTVLLLLKNYNAPFSHLLSYIIYSISFVTIYAASTIYHHTKNSDRKQILKKIDHACIYLFMGGCYTPFVIINMTESIRYWFLAFVWFLVIMGIIYKFLSKYRGNKLSLILYFAFGFLCFLAKSEMLDNIPTDSFLFLVYGGIFYSIGAIFYMLKNIPYHHAIWHILVLCGSTSHFFAVYGTY
ncbi:MAG: hemolysin III family protein [Bacteriovoracaceae bacterium]|jgi:hemolysin III|nr:hemolysin III family protein [Bacteriovoracaceae bacterium]